MAPLAKQGGPHKKSWIAIALAAIFVMGLLSAVAFGGDVGGATSSSGSTDTTAASSSSATDTSLTDTTPAATTSTDTTPTDTTSMSTPTTTTGSSSTFTPTISSDAGVYGPGATVTLNGAGWLIGEAVHIFVNDDQGKTWSYSADVTADANGSFTLQFQLPTSFIAVYTCLLYTSPSPRD